MKTRDDVVKLQKQLSMCLRPTIECVAPANKEQIAEIQAATKNQVGDLDMSRELFLRA
jgi:hypothetical protein